MSARLVCVILVPMKKETYPGKWKRILRRMRQHRCGAVRALCLMAACVLFVLPPMEVQATRVQQLQNEKAQTQNELNAAQSEQAQLEGEQEEIAQEMDEINTTIVELMAGIQILEGEIADLEVQIGEKQAEYDQAKHEEEVQYEAMKKRLKYMYERGDHDYVEILLSSSTFAEMINKSEYIEKLYEYDRNMILRYQAVQKEVAEKQKVLEEKKAEQEESKTGLQEEQAALDLELAALEEQYENVEERIEAARTAAAQLAEQLKAQTRAIQAAVEEEARRAAEARARAEEEARKRAAEEARARAEAEARAKAEAEARQQAEAAAAVQQAAAGQSDAERIAYENAELERQQREQEQQQQNQEPQETAADNGNTTAEPQQSDYADIPATGSGKSSSSSSSSSAMARSPSGATGQDVVNYACQFVGHPYVYGGNSLTNGCDCSGFTMLVYKHFGYTLGRTDVAQRSAGIAVDGLENARPGDIICYPGHVAIYCGNGTIVHASTAATGIKYSSVTYRTYICIRRLIY